MSRRAACGTILTDCRLFADKCDKQNDIEMLFTMFHCVGMEQNGMSSLSLCSGNENSFPHLFHFRTANALLHTIGHKSNVVFQTNYSSCSTENSAKCNFCRCWDSECLIRFEGMCQRWFMFESSPFKLKLTVLKLSFRPGLFHFHRRGGITCYNSSQFHELICAVCFCSRK